MKRIFKQILPDLLAILFFIVLSFCYFFTAVTQHKQVTGHDNQASVGYEKEMTDYSASHNGKQTRWVNSILSGMPTYQLNPSYTSTNILNKVSNIYHLWLPQYVWYVFVMLLGFYILMRVLKCSVWLSTIGAVFWAFSSYFFILITAGHIWKLITLAYIPPTIAGMILAYRGKYLEGGLMAAFFASLQIFNNHIQMSYYFFMLVMLILLIYYAIQAGKEHTWSNFIKATVTMIIAGIFAIGINASNLYHTYEYSKESIRSKSELTIAKRQYADIDNNVAETVTLDESDATKHGLSRSYITEWSYGLSETWSLLIPNIKGGTSAYPLTKSKKAMEVADSKYRKIYSATPQYWGDQPGTMGPVYVGAFVCFLFVLSLFIVKNPMKWALLAATVLSVFLAWGKNMMWFTNLFLDYVPLYDKFRTVSSILVVAEFTIPILAVWTLKEIIDNPSVLKENKKGLYISLGITAGIALLFAIFPRLFFSSSLVTGKGFEIAPGSDKNYVDGLFGNLEEIRIAILTADAWRSLIIIMIGIGLIWLFSTKKIKSQWFLAGVLLLCLTDMWSVNKRYLNDDFFNKPASQGAKITKTEADKVILSDKAPFFRVLYLSDDLFNENNTSYWHNSVGGYHAAKLRRYDELIEYHIKYEMAILSATINGEREADFSSIPVLNMLNTRYLIIQFSDGALVPASNPAALGNAWFVNNIQYVDNADQEIQQLYDFNPETTAIVNKRFAKQLPDKTGYGAVKLIKHESNRVEYISQAYQEGTVVFSEIYYPGWKAFIDGRKAEIGRANYVLRALSVPAGSHKIEFIFDPKSIHTTETIAYIFLILLLLSAMGILGFSLYRNKDRWLPDLGR